MRRADLPPTPEPSELLDAAAVLRRIELQLTRRLDGLLSGDFLSAAHGPGSEHAGARRYSPGDDARHIDWNLSARMLEPHVRVTEADRELETTVVIDRSPSLDYGTSRREKRELALGALVAFGMLTVRGGNRLQVVVAGTDRLLRVPSGHDRRGMLAAAAAVNATERRSDPPGPGASLADALASLGRTARRRGLVVVISDFLDHDEWVQPLRRLALRHQVLAVQVTDPRESELPDVGMLTVVDAETGRRLDVQTGSPALRRRYAEAAQQRRLRLRRDLLSTGAEHLVLSTEADWVHDIAQFVLRRRAGRAL